MIIPIYNVFPLCSDYENFYPKDKKETPKQDEQKSESKGLCFLYSRGPNIKYSSSSSSMNRHSIVSKKILFTLFLTAVLRRCFVLSSG